MSGDKLQIWHKHLQSQRGMLIRQIAAPSLDCMPSEWIPASVLKVGDRVRLSSLDGGQATWDVGYVDVIEIENDVRLQLVRADGEDQAFVGGLGLRELVERLNI